MRLKRALILAGGKGERLRPLTLNTPKVLLKVQGKPIIQFNLELLKRNGVKEVVLAVGYLGKKIEEFLGSGEKFGLNIYYSYEKEFLGTAGALKNAESFLNESKRFIMMNGDELKEIDFIKMNEEHEKHNALATIALTRIENPKDWGTVKIENKKILEFVEKPVNGKAPSNLINAGAYILEKSVLDLIPEGRVSIEREVFPKLAGSGKLFGFEFKGQWFPTDTIERIKRAELEWREPF
jgi:mannose-1-phosphate guanylyltransferase